MMEEVKFVVLKPVRLTSNIFETSLEDLDLGFEVQRPFKRSQLAWEERIGVWSVCLSSGIELKLRPIDDRLET